jgi:hypothetical protein
MEKDCVCYLLTGQERDGEPVEYWGEVTVLARQTIQEAVDWRLSKHLKCRKFCLSQLDPKRASCKAVGHRLSRPDALLQEAALTIVAWHSNSKARGGPYVLKHLTDMDKEELHKLKVICDLVTWSEKRSKLKEIAESLPGKSRLRRHLEDRCFRCGQSAWRSCPCRKRNSLVVNTGLCSSAAASTSHQVPRESSAPMWSQRVAPMASATRSRQKAAPVVSAKRSRSVASSSRQPTMKAKTPRDRKNRDRSGEQQKSGAQKLKERGMTSKCPGYKTFKWGKKPGEAIMKANKNYKPKRRAREQKCVSVLQGCALDG